MLERKIENKLKLMVRSAGGIALKFVSPGYDGMPDRLLLFPDGKVAFVELKAPGKKPRALQVSRHKFLMSLGFKVFVCDNEKKIKEIIDEIQTS